MDIYLSQEFRKNIFILLLIIFPLITFAQNDSLIWRSSIIANIDYPIPASGSTFNRIYDGIGDVRLGYAAIKKKISFGGNFAYSYFRISPKVLDLNGTMTIVSPGITVGYEFKVFKKIFINSQLKCGYDFITFNRTDSDGNRLTSSHEGGISMLPMITSGYAFSKKFGIGFSGSYEVIFQHFGNDAVQEESTTRIIGLGICIQYKL